jgi:N-acetylglucosamine-6-phosphate deacetylase
MRNMNLYNASVVLGDRLLPDASVDISGGEIKTLGKATAAGAGESIDCGGLTLMPGFIDVHIHGAMGIDVNTADAEELLEIAKFLATKGVTSWVPTLVPDSDESYKRIILEIERLMEIQTDAPVAQAVGVHYEGVFANEKMCGALRPEFFKRYPDHQLSELPRLNRGVHMTTFAPEVDGGVGLAKELKHQGWIASIGHTKADVETLNKAFDAGARHVTHFFNAMTAMHHRDIGVVGWALANPEVTFDIIADGIHVHPTMLEFACRAKTPDNVSLISDAVAPAGLGDGDFELWGETITVENGRTQNQRGSIAGSVITMLDSVDRMLSLGFSYVEVARMASFNPARLLGIEKERGAIAVEKRADLVALDVNSEVRMTVIGGRIAYDNR